MSIATTINLREDTCDILVEAIEKTGCGRTKMVVLLMERAIAECQDIDRSFERIHYQERDPGGSWLRPHIRLREDEYEYALDCRKFFKMSFSAVIAMAIEKFLDDIVDCLLHPKKQVEMITIKLKIIFWFERLLMRYYHGGYTGEFL